MKTVGICNNSPQKKKKKTYRLDLTRIDLDNADARGDELLAHGLGEAAHGGLGGAVDAAPGVGLAAGDAADVDDVAGAAVLPPQEDRQDRLRHVDQSRHVRREHHVHVRLGDLGRPRYAFD